MKLFETEHVYGWFSALDKRITITRMGRWSYLWAIRSSEGWIEGYTRSYWKAIQAIRKAL